LQLCAYLKLPPLVLARENLIASDDIARVQWGIPALYFTIAIAVAWKRYPLKDIFSDIENFEEATEAPYDPLVSP
jgi:hypothetical protein